MEIALAALVAGLIGLAGPAVISRLPEPRPDAPPDPPPDTLADGLPDASPDGPEGETKLLYRDIAAAPLLGVWLAVGAALGAAVATWGLEERALVPVWVLFAGVGSWLTYVDWRTRYLPFLITAPLHLATLVLVALAALLLGDSATLVKGLIGNVAVFAVFLVIYLLGRRFGGAFGYGDVRLAGVIGLALGALGSAETLAGTYAGFGLGAVCGLVLSRLGVVDAKGFAFGPYLVVGAVLGVVIGQTL